MNNNDVKTKPNEQLEGTVEKVLFQSSETGFLIFILAHKSSSTVVKGYLPAVQAGQEITVAGAWIHHPKFGKQFEAQRCVTQLPTTLVGLKKYLGSGFIKGIGKSYAAKLIDHFGVNVLEIFDKQPERLKEVSGIGPKRIETIVTAWKDQKEISSIMIFLQEKGISPAYAVKIYKKYGHESVPKVQENPYRLAEDIWGISFKIADQIAQNLGIDPLSIDRIKAGIIFGITDTIGHGHLYVLLSTLKEMVPELLGFDVSHAPLITNALHRLYEEEKIKLLSHDDEHYVTLSRYYYSEKGVSKKIEALMAYSNSEMKLDTDKIYTHLRKQSAEGPISLNEDQQRGIMSCLTSKVSIVTGGPGTGKTTMIKQLLEVLDDAKVTYKLAAPTGRAAKRMMEGTGRYAETLHRLLAFDVSTMGFSFNEQRTLDIDYLIIDEASMIDVFLMYSLLKALPLSARVVFIGDVDQLPSVGAGNVLGDLIDSGKLACVGLKEIFRQAKNSLIIVNAHKINQGEFPVYELPETKKDFFYIKEDKPEEVINHLRKIMHGGIQRHGINAHNTMVLVPMNRGIVGTQKINHDLQHILNGNDQPHLVYAGTHYKLNDRVMQIRNNYDKGIFNGDIGTVTAVDTEDKSISVMFGEKVVEYQINELDEVVLAYAISIHKSQGSEFDAVIIPIFMQHFTLLQRNLIYTAITRAKKLCIFIGQGRAIAMAIKNNKSVKRVTFLKQFLTSDLEAR